MSKYNYSEDYKKSVYRIRKLIGILGVALPVLLLTVHKGTLLSTMSHYYYTGSAVFFIGTLVAFSLILISYKGYSEDDHKLFNDDIITTVAGIAILIAVILPTAASDTIHQASIEYEYCGSASTNCDKHLLGYWRNGTYDLIHLLGAGIFLILLGVMSFWKFVKANNITSLEKRYYQFSALLIWIPIALILIGKMFFDPVDEKLFPGFVFYMEWISVWSFGFAWLVKGRTIGDIRSAFKNWSGKAGSK